MISPYLCTDSHSDTSISLVPVYSAETRPIGEIGSDDGISNPDTVDTFRIGRSDANSPAGVTMSPPPGLRSCVLTLNGTSSILHSSSTPFAYANNRLQGGI